MGHYDDGYEKEYDRQWAEERLAAERDIPVIIADLESAARRLRVASNHVSHAMRIEENVQFSIAVLRGQLVAK